MKRFLLFFVFAATLFVPARADEVPLRAIPLRVIQMPSAPSPYQEVLVTLPGAAGTTATYEYCIVEVKTGRTLIAIPSVYRPDEGNDKWALDMASGADIYWNRAGTLLAVDEDNHQMMGTVFIVDLRDVAHPQVRELGYEDLVPLFSRRIDRYRIRVGEKGWIDKNHLELGLGLRLGKPGDSLFKDYIGSAVAHYSKGKIELKLGPEDKNAE